MADILFGRYAELLVGKADQEGLDLSDFRIEFEITKSNDPTANSGKISIYNLSQESRTFMEQETNKDNPFLIQLNAGYTGNSTAGESVGIYTGEILRAEHYKKGGDIVTALECSDSGSAIANSTVNVSYKAGTPLLTFLNAIAQQMNVEVGEIQNISGKQFLRPYAGSGKARNQLDFVAAQVGGEWSIQDGVLQIIQPEGSLEGNAILLTSETGLIGSPNKKQDDQGQTEVQFTALLQPLLKPDGLVRLESRFLEGDFKIKKLTHKGDTRSGPWFTECEAI